MGLVSELLKGMSELSPSSPALSHIEKSEAVDPIMRARARQLLLPSQAHPHSLPHSLTHFAHNFSPQKTWDFSFAQSP